MTQMGNTTRARNTYITVPAPEAETETLSSMLFSPGLATSLLFSPELAASLASEKNNKGT